MVNIGSWARLDLRQRSLFGPYDDQLVAIRRIEIAWWHTEHYHVGSFFKEKGKTFFREINGSIFDVAKLRKKDAIWWTPLPVAKPAEFMLRDS